MKNLCKCDHCGKIARMELEEIEAPRDGEEPYEVHDLPRDWKGNDAGDLCRDCHKVYLNFVEGFENLGGKRK